ncbi:MAG: ribonuclease HII [Betaproteobacteria bacterium]|nr:ribonuclease HII [Betaproteobacteria bacterium]
MRRNRRRAPLLKCLGADVICGVDEAGRGPLAGPVYAAAVILGKGSGIVGLADSKKLSERRRDALAATIKSGKPVKVLVDGNRLPALPMLAQAIVGGDAKVAAISAASIVAKVTRDRWCEQVHERFPQYGFDRHKGYPTAAHVLALTEHGVSAVHRRSFGPVRKLLPQGA